VKKSANPAAIIGGILFLLSALVLLMINLSTMNMLDYSFATDQLLRVNLIPILYVVTAIFLFVRRPKAAVPVNRPLSSRQVKKEKLRHEGLVPVSKGSQTL